MHCEDGSQADNRESFHHLTFHYIDEDTVLYEPSIRDVFGWQTVVFRSTYLDCIFWAKNLLFFEHEEIFLEIL